MGKRVTFGSMCTAKIRYAIIKLNSDNTHKFVTEISFSPKEVKWEDGKKALLLDKKYAEDVCLGLNANGYGCFVVEIPDYFDDEDFTNVKKEEENEEK